MNKHTKKQYVKPHFVVHGDMKKITKQGGQPNADAQNGPNGTAFSPG